MNLLIFGQNAIADFNKKISTVRSRRNCSDSNISKYTDKLKTDIRMIPGKRLLGTAI